ncbi:MAG: Ig-like domain-containing protein [Gammaproteobacteria bacterium]
MMKMFERVTAGTSAVLAVAFLLQGCGATEDDNNLPPGTPRASDDVVRVTATGATAVAVLANDADPDNDPLTVTITESPFVGTASVNTDKTVRLDLPTGFRGVTRFKYKVTDPSGKSNSATTVVFVDADPYRVLFAGSSGSTQPSELYMTDLVAPVQVSKAATSTLRLQDYSRSPKGSIVVYTRADPANTRTTTEMYLVQLKPVATPVRIPAPAGRRFTEGFKVAISADDRWIAVATDSTTVNNGPSDLYVVDATNPGSATRVTGSDNLSPAFTQFVGDQPVLYFFASPPAAGNASAMYRVPVTALSAPEKVSPLYNTNTVSNDFIFVSPDQSRILIFGQRASQDGLFGVDTASPATETSLSTNLAANERIEAFDPTVDLTRVVYLSRSGGSTTARVSVVPTDGSAAPQSLLTAPLTNLSGLKPDASAVLVTRGTGGAGANGLLAEISTDTSGSETTVTSNVGTGSYDETGDRVITVGTGLRPGVIQRGDFGRTGDALISSSNAAPSLFQTIEYGRSAALFSDSASNLGIVNFAAPGKVLTLTSMTVDSSAALRPTAIVGVVP